MATPAVNLLPPELRRPARRARRSYGLVITAALALALLAGYDTYLVRAAGGIRREAAVLAQEAAAGQASVDRLAALRQEETSLRNLQARYQNLRGPGWSTLWQAISTALPAGVEVRSIDARSGAVTLTGAASSLPVLAEAEERLASVPGVKGVALQNLRGDGARIGFTLQLTIAGAEGGVRP